MTARPLRRLLRLLNPHLRRRPGARGFERPVGNLDARASEAQHDDAVDLGSSNYPPGYVKSYDDGRPRK